MSIASFYTRTDISKAFERGDITNLIDEVEKSRVREDDGKESSNSESPTYISRKGPRKGDRLSPLTPVE